MFCMLMHSYCNVDGKLEKMSQHIVKLFHITEHFMKPSYFIFIYFIPSGVITSIYIVWPLDVTVSPANSACSHQQPVQIKTPSSLACQCDAQCREEHKHQTKHQPLLVFYTASPLTLTCAQDGVLLPAWRKPLHTSLSFISSVIPYLPGFISACIR